MKSIILDFGTHEIKFLRCVIDSNRLHIEDFSVLETKADYMKGLGFPDSPAWAAATIHLNELEWLRPEEETTVMAALPAAYLETRFLRFPFRNEKKIEKVLPFELESAIPFDIEEIQIRNRVLEGEGTQKISKKEGLVLTLSYKRDLIKLFEIELRKFQFSIPAITAENLALSSLRQFIISEHPVYGHLHMGHSKSEFLLLQKSGNVLGVRTFWWGGKNILSAIEKEMSVDSARALQELKRMESSKPATEAIDATYREFFSDFRQTMKGFLTSGLSLPKPFFVYVSGPASRSPSFLNLFEEQHRSEFDLRVKAFPLEGAKSRSISGIEKLSLSAVEKSLPAMSVALSQMRNNRQRIPTFSETSFQLQRNLRRLRTSSFSLLRKVAVLLIAPFLYTILSLTIQSKENTQVLQKLQTTLRESGLKFTGSESSDQILKRMKSDVKMNVLKINQITEDHLSPLIVLTELSKAIPSSLKIDVRNLKITPDLVTAEANTSSKETADQIVQALKSKFPKLKSGAVSECKDKKDCKAFSFEIEREKEL